MSEPVASALRWLTSARHDNPIMELVDLLTAEQFERVVAESASDHMPALRLPARAPRTRCLGRELPGCEAGAELAEDRCGKPGTSPFAL